MSKNFKIKKYWVLALCMMLCSITLFAHDFKPTVGLKSSDTIPLPVIKKSQLIGITYTQCFEGVFEESDETNGAHGLRPKPGTVTYTNESGQIKTIGNLWAGNPITITYRTVSHTSVAPCCSGNPITAQLNSAVGTDVQIRCAGTAITNIVYGSVGAITISSSGLPSGVNATFSSNIVTISGTPIIPGVYNYLITLTNANCIETNLTGTITVNGNSITLSSGAGSNNQSGCLNTAINTIRYTTAIGTTSVTFSGLPSGVTGSFANNIATISGTSTVSGTFPFTVNSTSSCGTSTASGTITVTPNSTVSVASSSPTLCINTGLTTITHTTTGVTSIAGTPLGLPSGVNAAWTSNVLTISGTPTTTGAFNYSIPLTGSCGTATAIGTIIVMPNTSVSSASANPTLCINTPLTSLTHTTEEANGIGIPAGLPSGVSASWANNILTISGTPTVSGTFDYSIPVLGSCSTANATGTITVNKIPSLTTFDRPNQSTCVNVSIAIIRFRGTLAIIRDVIYSGLPPGVVGQIDLGTAVSLRGAPTVSGSFPYTVTVNASGSCGIAIGSGTIIVTPNNNTITLNSAVGTNNQSKNINTAIDTITYNVAGATDVSFSGLPAGVTGSFTANTATISGTPIASGSFNYTVNLTGGCGLVTAQGTINVLCEPITGVIKVVKSPSYSFLFSSGKISSALACQETAFPVKFYAVTSALVIDTQLYLDESLKQPVSNASLWYQYKENAISYKINNSGKIVESNSCVQIPPSTQTYRFYARHPFDHSENDYVIYIDANGVQRTLILTRTTNVSENPCQEIEAQRIIEENGVGNCDSRE
jgi:hypothetical protein